MIGRKLGLLRRGEGIEQNLAMIEMPFLKEVKSITFKNIKRYGYIILVGAIRLYVRSENFLKLKLEELKAKAKEIRQKNGNGGETNEVQEASKFLKMVSDYKHKIRKIKHRIHEEEKNS